MPNPTNTIHSTVTRAIPAKFSKLIGRLGPSHPKGLHGCYFLARKDGTILKIGGPLAKDGLALIERATKKSYARN